MAAFLQLAVDDLETIDPPRLAHLSTEAAYETARAILRELMLVRRSAGPGPACGPGCRDCLSPHLPKVASAVRSGKPVTFVLPAFPGKSPNLAKVLGALPDMAERLALRFLEGVLDRIRAIYPPGAELILCSDGRVFSDVVGMREDDVTEYRRELARLIGELGLGNISTFHLDEEGEGDFVRMRRDLMKAFGAPLERLKEKVRRGALPIRLPEDEEAHRMYCGITRFLVEDATFPGQTKSRTAIQRECKAKAYEVIRRSNAWSELLSRCFPEAVRLSIHPQACGSRKLGIRLVGTESWMTPWHGVAVRTAEGFILLKRREAEARGARLVLAKDGRPSHFELPGEGA